MQPVQSAKQHTRNRCQARPEERPKRRKIKDCIRDGPVFFGGGGGGLEILKKLFTGPKKAK